MANYQGYIQASRKRPVQHPHFDGFGERLPECDFSAAAPPRERVSRLMLRLGTGLFWSLVIVVVAARVIYFDPDLAAKFGQFAAVPSVLRAIFGA
jgi:hypothetical protein